MQLGKLQIKIKKRTCDVNFSVSFISPSLFNIFLMTEVTGKQPFVMV